MRPLHEARCCIVGGGPAGMMLGWLLARAGVAVIVLEKHADFFRDFRGDTIHPSTLAIVDELGALERLLTKPHTELERLTFELLGERAPGPDFRGLPAPANFMALMPQWDFLDFVREEASRYPQFHLLMEHEVTDLIHDGDRIVGVNAKHRGQRVLLRADLVVGTDGRRSTVRSCASLPARDLGAPIDVLWLRVPREAHDADRVLGTITGDRFLVMLDRGDYWQCAFVIEKGSLPALQARGLGAFRDDLRAIVPWLDDRVDTIESWDEIKLLTVVVDRLTRWWAPGVLCIGDAAHAMSPVGGVGINLAIQDAVAAANLLWHPLAERHVCDHDLAAVQARRERATRRTQSLQLAIHDHLLAQVLAGHAERRLKAGRWLLRHVPAIGRFLAHSLALGFQPEHVESPDRSAGQCAA